MNNSQNHNLFFSFPPFSNVFSFFVLLGYQIIFFVNISILQTTLTGTACKQFSYSVDPQNIKIDPNPSKLFHTILLNTTEQQFDSSFLYFTPYQRKTKPRVINACIAKLYKPLICFASRGVLINSYGTKIIDNIAYGFPKIEKDGPQINKGVVLKTFPQAICLTNNQQYLNMWGHWIKDFLACLLMFLEPIYQNLPIITFRIMPNIVQLLEVLGVKRENIIDFKEKNDYVFVDELYSFYSTKNSVYMVAEYLSNARRIFHDRLNLSKEKPNVFLFKNRLKGERRYVNNMIELFNISKQMYPQYNWQYHISGDYDIFRVSKLMNSVVLYVAPTGSNANDVIFMQSNTVYLNLMSRWIDYPITLTSVASKINMVILYDKNNNHWRRTLWNFSSILFKDGLQISFDILRNKGHLL